ncbi:thioredoxin family protein [Methanospirillum sp. J.3.6.1-F.2.7.3]|jgi:thioredoxin-like negative regulator of GroEL|uniref:Thioredoxin family protein n=2 Tax=Methanospirillum TaxID=2202 RepID=A0A8E7AYM4_9EURY|nr:MULTISPECIES: thioredoxin family protein [Methanospirillum]MDX8551034.1 thioredoxin family protein [Methanospirillum hungatei]NLW76686.1 thioredoxin family protein [Methanomicrobiales archaeon]QVV87609.1 thioredoxin family protein [Methanospirillum sp. J.3.6.1-F.2.7.3]QXO95073.1 thioredoxin family protein [Methanospirillum hungatei]
MTEENVQEINDIEWEKLVERNEKPVFVMFYSPSCTHCIRIMPSVEDLAKDFGTEVSFVKLNLLRFDYIGERYGVMATPTFIFFCGGKPVQTRVGAIFPVMLKKMVEEMVTQGEACRLSSTEWKYEITGYG